MHLHHLLSRKFLLSLAALSAGCALAYLGKLDATAATLIGGIASGYLAGNVTQKIKADL